jgi:hypothetical protein
MKHKTVGIFLFEDKKIRLWLLISVTERMVSTDITAVKFQRVLLTAVNTVYVNILY